MIAEMTGTIEDFKTVIVAEFQSLTNALSQKLDAGFNEVASELKTMRQEGNLPVTVVQSMISSNNDTYKSIIKIICWVFGAIIVALIGLKLAFPNLLNVS